MKSIDLYTKIVLTVIAACLVILTLSNVDIIPSVRAGETEANVFFGDQPVRTNYDGSVNVRIVAVDGILPMELKKVDEWNMRNGVPVEVKNVDSWNLKKGVPVEIKSVDEWTLRDGIPVRVKNVRDF